jgi:hypothetical protein
MGYRDEHDAPLALVVLSSWNESGLAILVGGQRLTEPPAAWACVLLIKTLSGP